MRCDETEAQAPLNSDTPAEEAEAASSARDSVATLSLDENDDP